MMKKSSNYDNTYAYVRTLSRNLLIKIVKFQAKICRNLSILELNNELGSFCVHPDFG